VARLKENYCWLFFFIPLKFNLFKNCKVGEGLAPNSSLKFGGVKLFLKGFGVGIRLVSLNFF